MGFVPPFSHHAVDDIAVAVHQDRRRRRALAIFGEEIGNPAGWRFDQPGREIELRKWRLHFPHEVSAQRIAPLGVLALRGISHPAAEFGEELTGLKMLVRTGDSVSSGHVFLLRSQASVEFSHRIGIRRRPEVGKARQEFGLPKSGEMQQFPFYRPPPTPSYINEPPAPPPCL